MNITSITRGAHLLLISLLISSLPLLQVSCSKQETIKPVIPRADLPNIVLLISDDADNRHYSFKKHPTVKTPNIDLMALQGVTFTNAYSLSSRCRATLGSIATGLLPHQNNIYANRGVKISPTDGLELPNQLKNAGYTTYLAGKFWEPYRDKWGFEKVLEDTKTLVRENQYQTLATIKNHGHDKPFFLWWAPLVPHLPHNPPEKYIKQIDMNKIAVPAHIKNKDRAEYLDAEQRFEAMTLWLDDSIGELVQALKDSHQYDNTLFIFLADNGYSSTFPSKGSAYEKGLQCTLMFYWPNKISPALIEAPVNLVDVYATILDLVNLPVPPDKYSHSLKKAIDTGIKANKPVFGALYPMFTGKGKQANAGTDLYALYMRDQQWKYIFYAKALSPETEPPIYVKYQFMPHPIRAAGSAELFNLANDPDELTNLANLPEYADKVAQMHARLLYWWQQTKGPAVPGFTD